MVRPSDWFLVGLDQDPVPGDGFGIRQVAQKYSDIAYVAAGAASLVRGMRSSSASEAWVGDAGEVFRSETARMPGELSKADDSYSMVAAALTAWASALEDAQAQADRGLALARDAHTDLLSAQSAYDHAHTSWSVAHAQQLTQQRLQKQYQNVPPPSGVTVPTEAQLRATTRNVLQARTSMDAAQTEITSATARLDAAKRLVLEAKAARDEAEHRTVTRIGDAMANAVKPSSVWEAIQDSAEWQAIVVIATVVLTIVSIVAIFVGGPLVWAIIAAATVLLMVNALLSIAQGKNAWLELGLLALGLIPGGRLLTLAVKGARAAIAASAATRIGLHAEPALLRVGELIRAGSSLIKSGGAEGSLLRTARGDLDHDWMVSMMGSQPALRADRANLLGSELPTIGSQDSVAWLSPAEDILRNVTSPNEAMIQSGLAPSIVESARNGDAIYGLFVRGDRLALDAPLPGTAGASEHFLEGGHTAINIGGGYMVTTTREFVMNGGVPVAAGDFVARFEQLSERGRWAWRVVRVF